MRIGSQISCELMLRSDRLLERRRKQAGFRDTHRALDSFDFTFNPKMNRSLVFDLATCGFIEPSFGSTYTVTRPLVLLPPSDAVRTSFSTRGDVWC